MSDPVRDIIYVLQVVAFLNPPIKDLAKNFEEFALSVDLSDAGRAVSHAHSVGDDVFEALGKQSPRLADAIHDFIYQVACPHRSIIFKNLARERVIKVIFLGSVL